jgi:ABC-type branched-subunit amino acid transport system ATPase component
VIAKNAEVHYGITGVVVGQEIHVQGARTVLLVGRNVTGEVTTLIDSRSALIAGLTSGLFTGLLFLLGQMLFRRK